MTWGLAGKGLLPTALAAPVSFNNSAPTMPSATPVPPPDPQAVKLQASIKPRIQPSDLERWGRFFMVFDLRISV
jgi:hypothetical protein